MPSAPSARHHVLVARDASSGTIAGATVGAVAAVILMLLCTLPFILKFRRKRRLRRRQEKDAIRTDEMGTPALRPPSQAFSTHVNRLSHVSNSRLASAAATLSDHDSQIGKEYGPDGVTFHRSAAPSPALVGKTLPSCSPAPSIAMAASSASLAEAVMAASRKNSPAIKQGPFTPPAEKQVGRSPTFGTMTTEPQPISRSATGMDSQHSQTPSVSTFRKLHNKVFHRGSTRSSGSESRATGSRSPDMDLDEFGQGENGSMPRAPYLVDDKPVMGGAAEEYYLGAPMSPPQETENPQILNLMTLPATSTAGKGVALNQKTVQPQQLGSPFNANAPLSPTSPFVKDEELSSEDGGKESYEAKRGTLSPPPGTRGLPFGEQSPKKFEPPPSPSQPAPGTVNPMEMMKPSTAAEQAAWVDTELWKMENSPPPQLEPSPVSQFEPSPEPHLSSSPEPQFFPALPYQQQQSTPTPAPAPASAPATERPQFQAVVRHPTQMDITAGGQAVPHHEEQIITDISDTSSPGTGFDMYAYGPSPSNHTSPDTRITESAYTGTPSPRSSLSNRPVSSNGGTEYLRTSGDHSRPPSQADGGSPKPSSYACDICGSKFDQVHKLNHHKRYHERPHQCPQCDKRFGTKTHLDRHINDKHNKTRKYHCTVAGCAYSKQGGGKSFPRKDNWRRHMQNKHSVQNPPEPVEEDVTMQGA